jgi:glycosyltransferase involved in cell wall biosynthesis
LPFTERIVLAKQTVSPDFPTRTDKKVLVRNFASLEALRFAADENADRVNDTGTLVHLGLFGKHRGWPQVLEAMARMRHSEARLKVIGDINDGTRPEFEARVKELGLAERVEIYDWMPFREAFMHLTKGHVGLVAFQPGILNHDYAMPHKMFDYMAAGMAVLCPAFAVEVAPIVEETQAGVLIDPASPEDIAEKLDGLLDDRKTLSEMGRCGQNAVREKYNWDTEAQILIKMYAELENK